jgi:hypothetical protein
MDHRAEYKTSYLAFVDVLGWKRVIEQIGAKADRFEDIINVYATLDSHEVQDQWAREVGVPGPELPRYLVASDSIILTTADDARALHYLVLRCGRICADLLRRGFMTRGAIVRGRVYHQGRVIFGEALTAAYLQEKHSARYPRLLVAPEIVETLMTSGPFKGPWAISYADWFARDQDGFSRLNPFANLFTPSDNDRTRFLTDAASAITKTLTEHPPRSEEFAKAHWLAELYNAALNRLESAERVKVDGISPIDLSVMRDKKV